MKIRPLHDRILIKRVAEEETVRGGIIIPDSAKEKPHGGRGDRRRQWQDFGKRPARGRWM